MKKEMFHKKWYFRLIQIIFWGFFIFLIFLGIWAILYEDDMPFLVIIWIAVLLIIYWFIKKIFYHRMFGDRNLPRKNKR